MSAEEIASMLEKTGFPVAYHHFEEGQEPEKPYVVYLFPGTDNFSADGKVYSAVNRLYIELYTEMKEFETERKLETVLDGHGIFYEKREGYLATEKMYEVLYETEVQAHAK